MRTAKAAIAVLLGAAGAFAAIQPVLAAGDTERKWGCAAHWRNTAAWNECIDSPGISVQLQVDCNWSPDHYGTWRWVQGSIDPSDEFECRHHANSANNAFK